MLYVQFKCGAVERHIIASEAWLELGRMIEWLFYTPEEIYYIERSFYVN